MNGRPQTRPTVSHNDPRPRTKLCFAFLRVSVPRTCQDRNCPWRHLGARILPAIPCHETGVLEACRVGGAKMRYCQFSSLAPIHTPHQYLIGVAQLVVQLVLIWANHWEGQRFIRVWSRDVRQKADPIRSHFPEFTSGRSYAVSGRIKVTPLVLTLACAGEHFLFSKIRQVAGHCGGRSAGNCVVVGRTPGRS